MQTKEQRRYWAEQNKLKRASSLDAIVPAVKPKPTAPVLLATSLQEYKELRKQYPDMHIKLDTSGIQQQQLFDTRDLRDV